MVVVILRIAHLQGAIGREASQPKKRACPGETPHLAGNAIKTPDAPELGSGLSKISGGSSFADDPQARTYFQS